MNKPFDIFDTAIGYLVGHYNVREARDDTYRYIQRIDEGPETPNAHYEAYVTTQDEPRSIHDGEWVILKLEVYSSLSHRGEEGNGKVTVSREVDRNEQNRETFSVPATAAETIADTAETFLNK